MSAESAPAWKSVRLAHEALKANRPQAALEHLDRAMWSQETNVKDPNAKTVVNHEMFEGRQRTSEASPACGNCGHTKLDHHGYRHRCMACACELFSPRTKTDDAIDGLRAGEDPMAPVVDEESIQEILNGTKSGLNFDTHEAAVRRAFRYGKLCGDKLCARCEREVMHPDVAEKHCPGCGDPSRWAAEGCPGLASEADPPGTSSMSDHGPNFNPPRSETVSPRTGPVGTLDLAEIRDRMKAHGQLSVATSDGVIEVKVTVTKRDSAEGRATARGCGCVCRECLRADGATHQVCIHRCGLARRAAVPASGDAQGVSLTNRQIAERLGDMVKGAEAWLPRHENALVRMLEEQRSEAAPTGPDNLTSVESHCATCARCQTYRKMADDEARRLGAELAKLRAEKNDRHQKAFEAVRGSADAIPDVLDDIVGVLEKWISDDELYPAELERNAISDAISEVRRQKRIRDRRERASTPKKGDPR